MQTQSYHVET